MTDAWATPAEIRDVDLAFPARGVELTPRYEDVPEQFKSRDNEWSQWVQYWFSHGDVFSDMPVYVVEGIDGDAAARHLQVVLGCYGTKHEHKIAGAAWLASRWFERVERVEA